VGGLERVVRDLARGQRQAGHRVHVVAILSQEEDAHPFVDALQQAGVEVHSIRIPNRAYRRERALLSGLCNEIRPHVVHTHGYRSDVVDAGVARRLGIPTVSTVHGFTRGGIKGRLYEWLQRRRYRQFDAVVAVSRPQIDELRRSGVQDHRLHLIPNGWMEHGALFSAVNARRRLDVPLNAFHVGWVGRLTHEKGADVLVGALANLSDLPMVVSIIGAGRDADMLRALARARAGSVDVRWHGLVPDAGTLFTAFDVFVLSSRTEGTPIALFEAMAARAPIIATGVGGVPDVVSAAEAIVVPSENAGALADAVRNVYLDPAAARARAQNAQARLAHQFAAQPWLARYDRLYRQLQKPSTASEHGR
jgi:glycosyltransferase involved in cell wall biosynthesis